MHITRVMVPVIIFVTLILLAVLGYKFSILSRLNQGKCPIIIYVFNTRDICIVFEIEIMFLDFQVLNSCRFTYIVYTYIKHFHF